MRTDRRVGRVPYHRVGAGGEPRERVSERYATREEWVCLLLGLLVPIVRWHVRPIKRRSQLGEGQTAVRSRGSKTEVQCIAHAEVAADAVPERPRRRLKPLLRVDALSQKNETGSLHSQRTDVDSVEALFNETEAGPVCIAKRRSVERRLEKDTGAAGRIKDFGTGDRLIDVGKRLARDVLRDVGRRVEDPGRLPGASGLARRWIAHYARPAARPDRVEHVGQQVPEFLVVGDPLQGPHGIQVRDGRHLFRKGNRRPYGSQEPRFRVTKGRPGAKGPDATSHDPDADERPCRVKGHVIWLDEALAAPATRHQAGQCPLHGFAVAEPPPDCLDSGPNVDRAPLGAGSQ